METTLRNTLSIFGTLRALNGKEVETTVEGEKKVIVEPYHFSSKACWAVAKNLSVLKPHIEAFEAARSALAGGLGDVNGDAIKREQFIKGLNDLLDQKVTVAGLLKIPLVGLNLDKNAIQPGLLADIAEHIEE